jgi:hypothetical protein
MIYGESNFLLLIVLHSGSSSAHSVRFISASETNSFHFLTQLYQNLPQQRYHAASIIGQKK